MIKILNIIIGILGIGISLFLSYGILIYTGKESDNTGYTYLLISFIIMLISILLLRKGIIKKS